MPWKDWTKVSFFQNYFPCRLQYKAEEKWIESMPPAHLSGEQWNDSGGAPMSPWLIMIHESSLAGPSWSFCLRVCLFFVLYNSHQSISPEMDIRTSCVTSCPSAPPNNFNFWRSLRPPLFPVTWETKVGHVHWDVGRERGETGWLIGDISPEGTLSAFWQKKWLTVSVCSLGRRGHPEVSERGGPEWQKMCKLCHHQNYTGGKRASEVILDTQCFKEWKKETQCGWWESKKR